MSNRRDPQFSWKEIPCDDGCIRFIAHYVCETQKNREDFEQFIKENSTPIE